MYEMYPETWLLTDAERGPQERPRRRPRKPHVVLPAVLTRQAGPTEQRHVAA